MACRWRGLRRASNLPSLRTMRRSSLMPRLAGWGTPRCSHRGGSTSSRTGRGPNPRTGLRRDCRPLAGLLMQRGCRLRPWVQEQWARSQQCSRQAMTFQLEGRLQLLLQMPEYTGCALCRTRMCQVFRRIVMRKSRHAPCPEQAACAPQAMHCLCLLRHMMAWLRWLWGVQSCLSSPSAALLCCPCTPPFLAWVGRWRGCI